MMLHDSGKIPTLKEASLGKDFPLAIEQILAKMLRRNPSERYQNIGLVAHDLSVACKGVAIPNTAPSAKAKAPKRSETVVSLSLNKLIGIGSFIVLITATIAGTVGYYLKSGSPVAPRTHRPPAIVSDTKPANDLTDISLNVADDIDEAQKKAEAKLANADPIVSKTVLVDHQQLREFSFPFCSMGKLCQYKGFDLTHFLKQANGLVTVPIDVPLVFFVQECSTDTSATLATPSVFKKIGTTEFHGLALEGEPSKFGGISAKKTAENLKTIIGVAQTWTNLEFISLKGFHEIDDALEALNKLKHLKNLQIIKCQVHSLQSAEQPVFRQLTGLRLEQLKADFAETILKQVDGSPNLQTLILNSTSPGNFSYLEGCTKLSFLEVNGYFRDDQLRKLSKVKSLKILYLSSDKIPEMEIKEIIRRLTQLKEIRLPKVLYTDNDVRNFTSLSDKVQFIDSSIHR
jgi:hypothetical protein